MTARRKWPYALVLGKALGVVLMLALNPAECAECLPGLTQPETGQLVGDLQAFEGFRGEPYQDTRGNATLGYGTRLPLSEAEGRLLVLHRARRAAEVFESRHGDLFARLPHEVRVRLIDAAYQLGPDGLEGFHDALRALDVGDCVGAAEAFRASRWERQTPARAERLAGAITRNCGRDGWP